MVEKMTAVWLIILTIMVCAAVPGVLILLTTTPPPTPAKFIDGLMVAETFLPSLFA